MILLTAQFRVHDRDRVDITRAGCERAVRDGKAAPGIILAPSWGLLRRGLAERRAAKGDSEAERASWERYAAAYRLEMRASYRANRAAWEAFLARERLVLVCFCAGEDAAARRCHRFLSAGYFAKLGADYRGELAPEDVIAPASDVEPPPQILLGAASGGCQRFAFTDGSGGGVICGGRPRQRRCRTCGRPASLLCDFPLRKKTCDAPICERCARTVGPDQHHCPKHPAAPVEGARP